MEVLQIEPIRNWSLNQKMKKKDRDWKRIRRDDRRKRRDAKIS
jgi:hypothetical protein